MNDDLAAELLQHIGDMKSRDKVYRLLKKGFDTNTIAWHVQRFGIDEAYFLLITGLPPRRRSWWKRVFRRNKT